MIDAPIIAVIATLDTKAQEAAYVANRIEAAGGIAVLVDIGVVGEPCSGAHFDRAVVAEAGGTPLTELLRNPDTPVCVPSNDCRRDCTFGQGACGGPPARCHRYGRHARHAKLLRHHAKLALWHAQDHGVHHCQR